MWRKTGEKREPFWGSGIEGCEAEEARHMLTRTKRKALLCKACGMGLGWSLAAAAAGVSEAALFWDTNGATAGAGGPTPSGVWDTTTSNWSTDPSGASPTQPWTPGESASFSADSDATGQFTV